MWKSIWDLLKSLFTYEDRLSRLEKQSEKREQLQKEITAELTAVYIELGRLAERDKWLAESFRQTIEAERSKQESEHWKREAEQKSQALERAERERARLLAELERRQLPSATIKPPDDDSHA